MGTAGSKPVDVPKAPASVSVLTLQELRAFIYLCLKPLSFISLIFCLPVLTFPSQQKVGIKTGKKICCCCPDTKKLRDECVVFKGLEHPDCLKMIEAHKVCLRDEGFDVK